MTSSTVYDERFAFGILGFAFSLIMFAYPWFSSIREIRTSGSVGESSPNSYLVTFANCYVWALYGKVHPHSTFTLSVNSVGCLTAIVYIGIYFWFSDYTRRTKLVCWLIPEVVILAASTGSVFYFGRNKSERYIIAGVMCIVSNLGAYFYEILIMRLVIRAKSVEPMPLFASIAFFASSVTWCTFSVLVEVDKFLLTTYAIGSFVATLELILYVCVIFPSVADFLLLRLVRRMSF